jgi:hypothetical protein
MVPRPLDPSIITIIKTDLLPNWAGNVYYGWSLFDDYRLQSSDNLAPSSQDRKHTTLKWLAVRWLPSLDQARQGLRGRGLHGWLDYLPSIR